MRDSLSQGEVKIKWAIGIVCAMLGLVLGALIGSGRF